MIIILLLLFLFESKIPKSWFLLNILMLYKRWNIKLISFNVCLFWTKIHHSIYRAGQKLCPVKKMKKMKDMKLINNIFGVSTSSHPHIFQMLYKVACHFFQCQWENTINFFFPKSEEYGGVYSLSRRGHHTSPIWIPVFIFVGFFNDNIHYSNYRRRTLY